MAKNNKTLQKGAMFTDIHFGKKANSETHNKDCLAFIDWFCEQVQSDPEIDHIMFLGDWNENRSSINIATMNYSFQGAKKLNSLGLPVYFVIGNHDLYHRHTREVHSIVPFAELDNFVVIEEPTVLENIGNRVLMCPYLFHPEYPGLVDYLKIPFWAGHFEFKGFEITGYGMKMPTGPDPEDFQGPSIIASGHFHKRQADGNVVYIGNTFPMDFGDAGDNERGMATFDFRTEEMMFYNWEECPKYTKTTLSDILDKTVTLYPNSRVKCVVDIPVSFEESTYLRQKFTEDYNLREFILEESYEIREVLSNTEVKVDWDENTLTGVNDLVIQMLRDIESTHIDNQQLVEIYQNLK